MMYDNPYFSSIVGQQSFSPGWNWSPGQMLDFGGLPGLGGPSGMFMQMMMQPLLSSLAGNMGFVPLQFAPTQGAYDHLVANAFFRERMAAVQQAAQVRDSQSYARILRSIAAITGTPLGAQQHQAINLMARDMGTLVAPFVGMFPEAIDMATGPAGSAAVMAHFMAQGSRYGRDPVTGLPGFSGTSLMSVTDRVHRQLFGDETRRHELRGLGAGRFGLMYDELMRRGLMGSYTAPSQLDSGLSAISGISGTVGNQEMLRAGESDRIANRLREMAGVVSAMRDIFGDMGQPNAPMAQLINGLQALTQGGLAHMAPGQMERTVRNVHNLVRSSGMSMDSFLRLSASGAAYGDSIGLNRSFIPMAAAHGAAFRAAYNQLGGGRFGAFGAMGADELTAVDVQLTTQAAASPLVNSFNAVLALGEEGAFNINSDAGRLAAAIRERRTSFTDTSGRTRSLLMAPQDILSILQSSGVSSDRANRSLLAVHRTAEFGQRFSTHLLGRSLQPENVINDFSNTVGQQSLLSISGLSVFDSSTIARLARAATTAMISSDTARGGISDEDFTNKRSGAIADAMLSSLTQAQRSRLGPNAHSIMVEAASEFLNQASAATAIGPYSQYRTVAGLRQAMNPMTIREAALKFDSASIESAMQTALSSFNAYEPLRRLSDMFQRLGRGGTFNVAEEALRLLGGASASDVNRQLANSPELARVAELLRERVRIGNMSPEDPERARAISQFQQRMSQMPGAMSSLMSSLGVAREMSLEEARLSPAAGIMGGIGLQLARPGGNQTTGGGSLGGVATVRFDGVPTVSVRELTTLTDFFSRFTGAPNSVPGNMGDNVSGTNETSLALENVEITIRNAQSGTLSGNVVMRHSVPNPSV